MGAPNMDWFQFQHQLGAHPVNPLDMYRAASLFPFRPPMMPPGYFPYPTGSMPPSAENIAAVLQHYEACRKAAPPAVEQPTGSQIDRESDVQQSYPSSCSDVEVNNQHSDAPDTEDSDNTLSNKQPVRGAAAEDGGIAAGSGADIALQATPASAAPTTDVTQSNRNYSMSTSNHSSNSQQPVNNMLDSHTGRANQLESDRAMQAGSKHLSGRKRPDDSGGGSLESPGLTFEHEARVSKKQRLVWTPELHARFMSAVHHIGVDKAVPKTILQLMNVDGMTRENVASHLQKYRLHLKRLAGVGINDPIPPDKLEQVQEQAMQEHNAKQAQVQAQAMQQQQQQQQQQLHQQQQQQQAAGLNSMAMLSLQYPFLMQHGGVPLMSLYGHMGPNGGGGLPPGMGGAAGMFNMGGSLSAGLYSPHGMSSLQSLPPYPIPSSSQFPVGLMGLQQGSSSRDPPHPPSSSYPWPSNPYAQMPYPLPHGYPPPPPR